MKTCLTRVAAAAAIGTLALSPQVALADSDNAAVVIHDNKCTGFIPTAEGGLPIYNGRWDMTQLISAPGHVQKIANKNMQMSVCTFDVPEEVAPGEVRQAENFACRMWTGETATESVMHVSPGGKATMICRKR
ncbi:hypothetical protein [Croceicoccus naphthovorans]|uniref:Uncharacterized protein n=1 Tax=Croceicoccus naphthovorans TaxID=1348774 RepID=A0A0G3XFE8_9SPHN|nr:hypothetical protein [Croceicoccus naphthovorans]AKM10250.1 hypothetical protein AB433_10180 [Croceicoccus naphthovorans]MBB3992013.1 hypothetical protein [Croceicoccus naphthovorans]